MCEQLEKAYDPKLVEDKWYKAWMDNDLFNPDQMEKSDDHFSIVIPPPNVTGVLHTGHALNITLQDILTRYKRMDGIRSLWLPGMDHAGIATQNVVEKQLFKAEGKRKEDLGREKFVEAVWDWKQQYGGTILSQLKKLGASLDWQRERFTLDEGLSKAVREVFVRLYHEGLIEKENYIINWCPRCQTALSDVEVEHEDKCGHLWHIRYDIKDPEPGMPDHLIVATTRPETMLGDTGIAFAPADERYLMLKGKKAILPLVGRELELIFDDYVDAAFGTGAVKVTPAHDPNDFHMGRRHNLEEINIMTETGIINDNGGEYAGLERYAARKKIVADLEAAGRLVKIENHDHAVGECYRCNTVVEPWLSEQWFVRMKKLAEPAIKVVEEGKIRFTPDKWTKVYYEWMHNIRDWCISRQIWWGHRIPAFYCDDCQHINVSVEDPTACEKCGSKNLTQDPDVLDTWFSSALWPFSTLGWPDTESPDLKDFYPTSILITGFDIIYFWVARMIMMGMKFMGDVPFHDVYITQLVRDEQGRKMSKSLGNAMDPLDVIEEYSCDALRFTLSSMASQTADIQLSLKSVEGYRNFINKYWNTARFTLMNLENFTPVTAIHQLELEPPDRWIIARLSACVEEVRLNLDRFNFPQASKAIYDFLWSEFADWYIEIVKPRLYSDDAKRKIVVQHMLHYLLTAITSLLHPFCPFVTEEVRQHLGNTKDENGRLTVPVFPSVASIKEDCGDTTGADKLIEPLMEVVRLVRQIRSESDIIPSMRIEVLLSTGHPRFEETVRSNEEWINSLTKTEKITMGKNLEKPEGSAASSLVLDWEDHRDESRVDLYIPISLYVDLDKERDRLTREIKKAETEMSKAGNKLNNQKFIGKAPADVVEKEKAKFEKFQAISEKLKANLATLEKK